MQLGMELTPIDFNPDALAKAILPNSVLTDYWAYIDLPRTEGGKAGRKTTGERTGWDCLPSWVKSLIDYLRETGELCHYGRMAVAGWMIRCGFTDEEIHEVFKHADDYNPRITQYHINDTREKYLEKGGKPMKCATVIEKCNGYKVPDLDCKFTRKPAAPSADPKPKAKPAETKPEERRETAPSTGRPVQTRLAKFVEKPREEKIETKPETKPAEPKPEAKPSVSIPAALIEDVARELRAPATIVEALVNWVLDYLSKYWSVGFDRLVFDLAAARDEEVRFALEVLGIEVKERKITDYGVAKLRTIVSTIIKYLERAGFVQYVREDYTVNLVKN
jgi:hypothetical protein